MTTAREIFRQQHVEYLRVPWEPGEAVSCRDFGQYDYGDDFEPIPVIEVPNARSEDIYVQTSFVEISNFHHLVNNHSDQIMVAEYLNLDAVLLLADAELPEDFADELENFRGYPIFDEDDWSEREFTEWVQSWEPDGYNRFDLESELGRPLTSEEDERLLDVLEELGAYQGETDPCACYPVQGMATIAAALDPSYKDED